MKNFTQNNSLLNKSVAPEKGWIRAVIIFTTLLLPAGALAQSAPIDDPAVYPEETEIVEQVEQQDYYQEEIADPSGQDFSNSYQTEKDYSNPYQQPVITEYEQDQMDQAKSALGVPESRRPEFNSFFEAEDRAIRSQEKMQNNEGF